MGYFNTVGVWVPDPYLSHYGTPMHSGRYPYGSGERPYQSGGPYIDVKKINKLSDRGYRDQSLNRAHTIPKGTVMYRTSSNRNENLNGSTYVTYTKLDRNHYRTSYVKNATGSDKEYEQKFTLKEDLKVPGRDELINAIEDVIKSESSKKEVVNGWLDMAVPEGTLQRAQLKLYSGAKNWDEYVGSSVEKFKKMPIDRAWFYTAQSLAKAPETKAKIIKNLQDKGYNAMMDEAGVGGTNGWEKEGIAPLIVFDSAKSLAKDNPSKELKSRHMTKAYVDYTKEIDKVRKKSTRW